MACDRREIALALRSFARDSSQNFAPDTGTDFAKSMTLYAMWMVPLDSQPFPIATVVTHEPTMQFENPYHLAVSGRSVGILVISLKVMEVKSEKSTRAAISILEPSESALQSLADWSLHRLCSCLMIMANERQCELSSRLVLWGNGSTCFWIDDIIVDQMINLLAMAQVAAAQ